MNNQSLQPEYMTRFQCIGAECEDTCCAFWNVTVDKETYHRYQSVKHPALQKRLKDDVVPRRESERSKLNYASMRLNSETGACSFLDHGLCAIQAELGESYLSPTCATYPRRINEIDGTQEVSAALSCPEAARLALLEPRGIDFEYVPRQEAANTQWNARLTSQSAAAPVTLKYLWDLRVLAIEIIQNRQFGLSHRIMLLAAFADLVDEAASGQAAEDLTPLIEQFRNGLAAQSELTIPQTFPVNHSFQLKLLNELLVGIMNENQIINVRYRDCLMSYLRGMQQAEGLSFERVLLFYEKVYRDCHDTFLNQHEYIMENYIVNLMFSTLFPVSTDGKMFDQVLYIGILYALIRMQLVGMCADQRKLTEEDAVRLIQSFTKNFDHSRHFKKEIVEVCKAEGVTALGHLSLLVMY
ncbi:hypothetical protein B1A99_21925 [Cohnella sp. CIP 111063]|uniref:flagellin lysine-N-methylase n=1 Tax=unclassified Cohnella TaxID=2636738 RepID=UPI000B8C279C|nr:MULTISPECIES: flagellin lysine-N-methylase [unclassified Cohnella]OXS55887.1 hypothetical protein B1A99_21925 [Cohnella sp. CIP 111063]PRX67089.1 lysine-N-methylase [Cohnella sp. SGD-V74]